MFLENECLLLNKSSKRSLTPGAVHELHLRLLIEVSSIHSEKAIKALEGFLVEGCPRKDIYERYGISAGYFSIILRKIKYIDYVVSKLAPYYSKKSLVNTEETVN
ncbi:PapB/FocB family fimbrial expression transcriptional regulator [Escherichia coli]|nr:PapB/FocB family fimbrial expression transcriptional regulator [Escherichia coli]